MDKTELLQKKCQACEIGGSPMPDEERDKALAAVEGWELKEGEDNLVHTRCRRTDRE